MFAEILSALRGRLHDLPPPSRERLSALMQGERAPKPGKHGAANGHAAVPAKVPETVWPTARIAFVQRLWGEGFLEVGGAEMTIQLAAAMSPSPQSNILDLCAGLGGGARALHERYGAHVTGLEAHPVLAKLGAAESFNKGTAKTASVEHFDPQNFTPREAYSGILVRESLFHQPHLGEVLARAAKALKPRGQMVLVDYVRVEHENPNSRYLAWLDAERQPVHPWSAKQYRAAFEQLGLELSEFEDMTDSYRKTVLQGWAAFLSGLHLKDLAEGEASALVDEAELWLRRIMAFEHSALRVIRIHATAPAGR